MVWSDPEIKKLSKEFVTVADEVYMLYPEDPGNLARVKDLPNHQFFKKYGEAMPKGDWNHPGTKQGIYMMGPNAEYLDGKFAASSDAGDIRRRLQNALTKWESLRVQQGYANTRVPEVKTALPPGISGSLIFRVNLRDMPRGEGDKSGARFAGEQGGWRDFVKWAWNENWVGLDDARAFVPTGSVPEPVPEAAVRKICQEVLVDNVRGQAPTWRPEHVKQASLTKRSLGVRNGVTEIEYSGKVRMESGPRVYDAKVYGRGEWASGKFVALDLVVIGMRSGAWQFNQREQDPGPAPMGVALSLFRP